MHSTFCFYALFDFHFRVLAGLLSAHLLIKDPVQPFGDIVPPDYDDELLDLAHDLASRLIIAFDNTRTGIPFPRVRLLALQLNLSTTANNPFHVKGMLRLPYF